MKHLRIPLLLLLFILGTTPAISADSQNTPQLSSTSVVDPLIPRIEKLETQWDKEKDYLKREFLIFKGELTNKSDMRWLDVDKRVQEKENAFDDRLKEKENAFDNRLKERENKLDTNLIILGGFAGVGTIFILATLLWVKQYFEAKIAELIDEKAESLKKTVENHELEQQWLKSGKITVLSLPQEPTDKLEALLKGLGFEHTNFRQVSSYTNIQTEIVIFNNKMCNENPVLVNEYTQRCDKHTFFVAYGPANRPPGYFTFDDWSRLVAANMPVTLFGHLMTLFRQRKAVISSSSS